MNVTVLILVGSISGGAVAHAQEASPQPSPAQRPAPDPRRQDITMMEMALIRALATGAQDLARQLKVAEPNSAFVTGTGRARGFILEGYGYFFDVDVPGMKQSVIWSSQMAELTQARDRAIEALNSMRPDDPLRRIAHERVRTIDRLMTYAQAGQVLLPVPVAPSPTAPMQLAPRDRIEAVTVADDVSPPSASSTAARALAPPGQELRPVDPNELYTESVKNALIEAMLRYSQFLKVGDDEWLTVAASDSDGPQIPGQIEETSRIIIRIKGLDLTAFQQGRLSRADVMKKVEVKEF